MKSFGGWFIYVLGSIFINVNDYHIQIYGILHGYSTLLIRSFECTSFYDKVHLNYLYLKRASVPHIYIFHIPTKYTYKHAQYHMI